MRLLRRGVPLFVAFACLGAAAVLALLAVDARAWQHTVTRVRESIRRAISRTAMA